MDYSLLDFIDDKLKETKNRRERQDVMIALGYQIIGSGGHKDVFMGPDEFVLKVGSRNAIMRDIKVHCLVFFRRYHALTLYGKQIEAQKLGEPYQEIDVDKLWFLRHTFNCVLEDIREDNVKRFGEVLKIIDAKPRREKWKP